MKTIQQFINDGIQTLDELKDALQLAMQLEFSTIPPYLCAQWSIRIDPDRVESLIHEIVGQEMAHLAIAGNVLSAIGGQPRLNFPDFIPTYPASELPGGIVQPIPVDLTPLTLDQIEVFMQIEHPDFTPVALNPDEEPPSSIGEFYREIIDGLKLIQPKIINSTQVPVQHFQRITSLEEAIEVLECISEEGEGVIDSPLQPPYSLDRATLAHYYLFKELYLQRRLVFKNGQWKFEGDQIILPDVYTFKDSSEQPELNKEFKRALTNLLISLEECWTMNKPLNVAAMFEISIIGKKLVKIGILPHFEWSSL
jgi:hypothetical protein